MKFDEIVDLLSEETWDFDTKKVVYVKNDSGFIQKLEGYMTADSKLLPSGLPPVKKPMFQKYDLAGTMADSQLWASTLLDFYHQHGEPLKPKEILRNAQVKPSDKALFNFYKDVKANLDEFIDYRLPRKKGEM